MRRRTLGMLAVAAAAVLASLAGAACGSILGVDGPYHLESDAATTGDGSSGDGTTSDAPGPDADATPGDGGPSEASLVDAGPLSAISAGRFMTCARYGGGVAKCWGQNLDGEFGNGTVVGSSVPIPAMGTGIVALFNGPGNTCAALGGSGACTGRGGEGQLLEGEVDAQSLVPVATTALPSAPSAFAPGQRRTCAIVANGDVYCAGDGSDGELGPAATGVSATPVKVNLGGAAAKAISGTWRHVCALTTAGDVYCWGDDTYGQLGSGSFVDAGIATPVHVPLGAAATEIGTGDAHSCAIVGPDSSNAVWCWGDDTYGQLGLGDTAPRAAAAQVPGTWRTASVGLMHTCGLQPDGSLWCWGHGAQGQLGLGDENDRLAPAQVGTSAKWVAVSAGGNHTCAIDVGGAVWCWGENVYGEVGGGDTQVHDAPVRAGSGTYRAVASGGGLTCAIASDGSLWCWGTFGQTAQPGQSLVPVQVDARTDWTAIAAGYSHACGVRGAGGQPGVYCLGWNFAGQLAQPPSATYAAAAVAVSLP